MSRCAWPLLVLVLAACGSHPDDEALGDLAAGQGRWSDALDAYNQAGSDVGLIAKRANAALEAGRPGTAAVAWAAVADGDTSRRAEAAVGLTRAAEAAKRRGDMLALATAIRGLRQFAPGWPVGRLALSLRLSAFPSTEDALALAPAILAASPARDVADSALARWAAAWRERGDCSRAAPLYNALARVTEGDAARDAELAFAACRLRQGLAATEAGAFDSARAALGDAVNTDPNGALGRRALIGLGDVHLQNGDLFAAQLAWRTAATSAAEPDSITDLALERLRAVSSTDSTREPRFPR